MRSLLAMTLAGGALALPAYRAVPGAFPDYVCSPVLAGSSRIKFLENAQMLYRLSMAAIHLCGGPAPRGTEEAVTRLTNSQTEAMRNVQLTYGTIGIIKG